MRWYIYEREACRCARALSTLVCGVLLMGGGALAMPRALDAKESLVIYTHRHYPIDRELFADFEYQHDVNIRVLQAQADELIERIVAEGSRTKADLLITVSAVRLDRAVERGILAPFSSAKILSNIPTDLRHPQNYWAALTVRARVIVYNKAAVRPTEVRRYRDLAAPRWRGALAMRTSSHTYNVSLLSALIGNHGAEAARRWVDGVAANLAYAPRGNDRDQIRTVAAGGADATLVNSYYYGLLAESDPAIAAAVGVAFPNQDDGGTHVDISGVAIVRHSANKALATRLIEFLTSASTQGRYSAENHEFPANQRARTTGLPHEWKEARLDLKGVGLLSRHSPVAVSIFDASDWQ